MVGQGGRLPVGGAFSPWSQRASHIRQIERAKQPGNKNGQAWCGDVDSCEDGVHERIGGVNQVKQGDLSQGRPGIEPHPQAHGGQGQVDENDLAPSLHLSLPAGITVEGATPPKGRSKWWTEGWTIYPSPVPHQRRKRGGRSLHQHPLSYGAPLRRAGGGHARRSLASLFRTGRGKSVLSRVPCGVSGKSRTTTARRAPSEREALWLPEKWTI